MLTRVAAIIAINGLVMIAAFILDRTLRTLPPAAQFVVQIPLLVIAVDEFRHWCLSNATRLGLTERDINAAFFFAAPLAALASASLLADTRALLRFH